jgi:MYXO-CTERM domain-containing protein
MMVGVALAVWWAPALANACSPASGLVDFDVDTSAEVDAPPEKPTLTLDNLHRATPKWRPGNSCGSPSSSITFRLEPYDEDVGYVFRVEDGELPDGIDFPSEPSRPTYPGAFTDYWPAEKKRNQGPFEFTVSATPIAKNGEPGPTSEPVTVSHPGSGGCSTTGHGSAPGGAWLLVLGGLALTWRRAT